MTTVQLQAVWRLDVGWRKQANALIDAGPEPMARQMRAVLLND